MQYAPQTRRTKTVLCSLTSLVERQHQKQYQQLPFDPPSIALWVGIRSTSTGFWERFMSTGMSWPIYSMQLIPKSSSDQTLFRSVTSPKALGRVFPSNLFFRLVKGSGQSLRNGQTPLANHSISASSPSLPWPSKTNRTGSCAWKGNYLKQGKSSMSHHLLSSENTFVRSSAR